MVWARPLSSSEGKSYCYSIQLRSRRFCASNCVATVFQHENPPLHKASSIHKWFVKIGVEELDWPAQSPDLNPIEHPWDGLDLRLRARLNHPTSLPDLTNALVAEWKSPLQCSNI